MLRAPYYSFCNVLNNIRLYGAPLQYHTTGILLCVRVRVSSLDFSCLQRTKFTDDTEWYDSVDAANENLQNGERAMEHHAAALQRIFYNIFILNWIQKAFPLWARIEMTSALCVFVCDAESVK